MTPFLCLQSLDVNNEQTEYFVHTFDILILFVDFTHCSDILSQDKFHIQVTYFSVPAHTWYCISVETDTEIIIYTVAWVSSNFLSCFIEHAGTLKIYLQYSTINKVSLLGLQSHLIFCINSWAQLYNPWVKAYFQCIIFPADQCGEGLHSEDIDECSWVCGNCIVWRSCCVNLCYLSMRCGILMLANWRSS